MPPKKLQPSNLLPPLPEGSTGVSVLVGVGARGRVARVDGEVDLGLDVVDRVAAKRDVLVEVQLDRLQLREVRSFDKLHSASLRVLKR